MLKLGRQFCAQAGRLKTHRLVHVASKRIVRDKALYNFSNSRSFLFAQERRLSWSIAVYNTAMGGKGSKSTKGSMEVTGDDKRAAGGEERQTDNEGQVDVAATTATEESQYVEAVVGKATEFGDNE